MNVYEYELEKYRRRSLSHYATALAGVGMLLIAFGVVVGVSILSDDELEIEGFANTASTIALGAGPYCIFGAVFVAGGLIASAVLTGPLRGFSPSLEELDESADGE